MATDKNGTTPAGLLAAILPEQLWTAACETVREDDFDDVDDCDAFCDELLALMQALADYVERMGYE